MTWIVAVLLVIALIPGAAASLSFLHVHSTILPPLVRLKQSLVSSDLKHVFRLKGGSSRDEKNVLLVTDSNVKSATVTRLLSKLSLPFHVHVKTCPDVISLLRNRNNEVAIHEAFDENADLNFSFVIESALNPVYENVYHYSNSSKHSMARIQYDLMRNTSHLLLLFDLDVDGDFRAFDFVSALHIPENVSVVRMRLPELSTHTIKDLLVDSVSNRSVDTLFNKKLIRRLNDRRILDRSIALSMTQALHKCLGEYFTVGRIESAIMNALSEREEMMRTPIHSSQYSLRTCFLQKHRFPLQTSVTAELRSVNNQSLHMHKLASNNASIYSQRKKMQYVASLCNMSSTKFRISHINSRFEVISPPSPLNTSELIRLGKKFLNFSPIETLQTARSLYDKGLITYPLSSSNAFTQLESKTLHKCAKDMIGRQQCAEEAPVFDVHGQSLKSSPAIRPVFTEDEIVSLHKCNVTAHERSLFDLILRTSLAAVLKPAQVKVSECEFHADFGLAGDFTNGTFVANQREVIFPGHLNAFPLATTQQMRKAGFFSDSSKVGQQVDHLSRKLRVIRRFSGSKRRYTPSELVKAVCNLGSIEAAEVLAVLRLLDSLERKKYIRIADAGYKGGEFRSDKECEISPTPKSKFISHFLKSNFKFIVDPSFSRSLLRMIRSEPCSNIRTDFEENATHSFRSNGANLSVSVFDAILSDGLLEHISSNTREYLSTTRKGNSSFVPMHNQYLGNDPETKQPIFAFHGKFGSFAAIGFRPEKRKTFSIPNWLSNYSISDANLVLEFRNLPRTLFIHPTSGHPVVAFIKCGKFCIGIGRGKKYLKQYVPLAPGVFPSLLTNRMVLNNLSWLQPDIKYQRPKLLLI